MCCETFIDDDVGNIYNTVFKAEWKGIYKN